MNFQQIMDCTEVTISMIKDHSSLVFYHIKDEPDTSDFVWLKGLRDKIYSHDSEHLNYIDFLLTGHVCMGLAPNIIFKPAGFAINFLYQISLSDMLVADFSFYPCTFLLHG